MEKIKVKGKLHIKVFKLDQNGKLNLVDEWNDPNVVVTVGKQKLCLLLANSGATNYISKVGFGTDNTAATVADTGLTNLYTVAVGSATYPSTTSVSFPFELGLTEYNGNTIYEYGLICQDDTLFSRKTRSGIEKDADVLITGTWTIEFI